MISFSALYELRCQSTYCEGVRWLNAEEQRAPAICAICKKRICDECAAGVRIPYDVLGEEHKPTDDQRYDCLVCSDCFKEEWA